MNPSPSPISAHQSCLQDCKISALSLFSHFHLLNRRKQAIRQEFPQLPLLSPNHLQTYLHPSLFSCFLAQGMGSRILLSKADSSTISFRASLLPEVSSPCPSCHLPSSCTLTISFLLTLYRPVINCTVFL